MNTPLAERHGQIHRFVLLGLSLLSLVRVTLAENNSNYVFNGPTQTTNYGGALSIPMSSPGTNNSLQIYNGGAVTNTSATIGPNGGDNFNFAIVNGSGSIWQNNGGLSIGSVGSNNRLTIANSGTVNNVDGYIGSTGSTNNSVIVTDTGSTWNNSGILYAGYAGVGAHLTISNGAAVSSTFGLLGGFPNASNNTVVVTGSNSLWNMSASFVIGYHDQTGGNTVTIADGGRVINGAGGIGNYASSGNNLVTVTGPNSLWNNTSTLSIGSANNQLIIANGGAVGSVSSATVGSGSTASNNTVVITGGNSVWTNSGSFKLGSDGSGNQITLSAGGKIVNTSGTTIGDTASSANNSVTVTGSGSRWIESAGFTLGNAGSGNQLIISNSGRVDNVTGIIGSSGNNNSALVTGSGSLWNMSGNFSVGSVGSNNRLTISNGGTVSNMEAYVGSTGSTNNTATVTDSGSTWKITEFFAGYAGRDSHIIITNNGTINAANTYFGLFSGSSNTTMLVTDGGVLNSGVIWLGRGANCGGNQLTIVNSGHVVASSSAIGLDAASGNNIAIVSGSGSTWSNTDFLAVGNSGSSNLLIVSGGGRVDGVNAVNIGNNGGNYNSLVVTGATSYVKAGAFSVGVYGHDNQATIANGGRLDSPNAYVGNGNISGSNAIVLVTGNGAVMSNSTFTYVGYVAPNARMTIANGGRVDSAGATIGFYNAPGFSWFGDNGTVEVTGAGSLWNIGTYLRLNEQAYGGSMIVSNGGRVSVGDYLYVGYGNSNANVVVTGAGSILQVASFISVGANGTYTSGNNSHVLLTDGGTLEVNSMVGGSSASAGSISNRGGVYQFTSSGPFVTPVGAGTISMTNGTVSYRGVVGADINNAQVGNISKSGNNTFQLNNSTNANPVSYKFDSVANTGNPTNYQRLSLLNNSRWVSAYLTNGTGGAIKGGAGDVVELTRNFIIQRPSNPSAEFDLASSTVLFSGGVSHTNAVTGDDFGHSPTLGYADGFTAVNFSYGKLQLGSASDEIYFTSGDGSSSNALYVLNLDLLGNASNVTKLHSPTNINIYYGVSSLAPANAYLNDQVYTLDGGGLLMPAIPEPSTMILLALAACAMFRRKPMRP